MNLPAATAIQADGSFTTQLASDLVNGTIALRARLRDAAGNAGAAGPTLNLGIVTADGDYDADGRADLAVYQRGTGAAPWPASGRSSAPASARRCGSSAAATTSRCRATSTATASTTW